MRGAFRFRRDVDYCSGAFLLFASEKFRELGGFDEAYAPAYYEESDFCLRLRLRLRQQGLRVIYEPAARVRHYEFASAGGMRAAAALQDKNRALFRKNTRNSCSLTSIDWSNIHLRGRLESPDTLYRQCRVFIAPTRFAAGIPHKVQEAAAHGVPAVVTPLLARQLGWRHEQEVLVAENPQDFAAQCLRLYRDAEL